MGQYQSVNSIHSACCENEKWYHKVCIMERTVSLGCVFICPLCDAANFLADQLNSVHLETWQLHAHFILLFIKIYILTNQEWI